jgi:UDP-3-O-[3-hydroxymyristoyl] glucosamine N-acyltransferase
MTAAEVARYLNGKLIGDADTVISGLAKIEEAGPHDLSFVANARYVRFLDTTQAGAILVAPGVRQTTRTVIEVADPYVDFLRLLEMFHPRTPWLEKGIHPTASIAPDALLGEDVAVGALSFVGPRCRIGAGTRIYPQAVIAADVRIGDRCDIHSRVSIREGVRIGNRVIIQDGVVIGSDGFGFAPSEDGYRKIPQLGTVVIEDDVEIGANTTIDRATLGETVIGKGTKLDNLIQVAHNVVIGSHTVVAAQTGISGSAKIGSYCRIGGQVGIVGHIEIGDCVQIAAKAGVGHDVPAGETVAGSPERPHALWRRIEASLSRLPDLFKRVRTLEANVFGESDNKGKADS